MTWRQNAGVHSCSRSASGGGDADLRDGRGAQDDAIVGQWRPRSRSPTRTAAGGANCCRARACGRCRWRRAGSSPAARRRRRCAALALAGDLEDYELSFESGERMQGRFLVSRLEYAGDFNGERNYTLALESSGEVARCERRQSAIAARRAWWSAGETLVLRPSFAALVAAEEELGPLFALVERASEGRLSLAQIAALVRPSVGAGGRRRSRASGSARRWSSRGWRR